MQGPPRFPRANPAAPVACSAARMTRLALALLLGLAAGPAAAFDLQGHRGARGLAPENTLPALARALSIGVTTLELDVGISADGVVMVAHDRRINPALARGPDGAWLNGPGPTLRSLTGAELERYDFGALRPGSEYAGAFPDQVAAPGARMPTLEAVVALTRRAGNDAVRFNIETKISPLAPAETVEPAVFARALIAELRRLGIAGRATIQSFDWRTLAVAASEAPEIGRAYLTLERGAGDNVGKGRGAPSAWTGINAAAHGNSTPRIVRAAGGTIWSPFHRDLDAGALAEARALGMTVIPWTVNDSPDAIRMLELGVDGLITDYPDRLRALLAERGVSLPAPTPVAP